MDLLHEINKNIGDADDYMRETFNMVENQDYRRGFNAGLLVAYLHAKNLILQSDKESI